MRIPERRELERLVRRHVEHPLLLADVGGVEALRARVAGERWEKSVRRLLERADRLLEEPIPQLTRSLYDDYFRTGRRRLFENPYHQRRKAVEDLTLAYVLTGKDAYLDRCRDYIWAIMEEFTWVVPAHARPPFQPGRERVVDLSSSGTAMLLADVWDLLHDDLDRETLEWMRHNILQRVLIPLRDHYDEQWWSKRYESNWCGVCNGNSGCALILVALDEPWSIDLLHKILASIDGFLSAADPDGAWVEGAGYWFYGFSRVIYFADLLAKVTDGRVDLLEDPRIKACVTFPVWTYLPPRSQVNFGDTGSTPSGSAYVDILYLFLRRYREPSVAWYIHQLERAGLLDGLSLRALLWEPVDAHVEPAPPRGTFKWYRRIGVAIVRSSWDDPDAPVLAVKAGHNGEPHNHIDVGQFVYHCYGNSFICDLGVGVYDREYFSSRRYENPVCGAEGHNLIFVNGRSQGVGKEYRGEIVSFERGEGWTMIKLDISKAYPPEVLSKAVRAFLFSGYNGLVLVDEIECEGNALVEARLHFRGDSRLSRDQVDICVQSGCLRVQPEDPSVEITIGAHRGLKTRDPALVNAQYIRLMRRASGGRARIKVRMVPYRSSEELNARLTRLMELERALGV